MPITHSFSRCTSLSEPNAPEMYLVHEIRFSFCTRSHSRRRVCRKGVPSLRNFYTKFNPLLYWPISSGGWETGQTPQPNPGGDVPSECS